MRVICQLGGVLLIALSACSSARMERPDPFPPTVITKEQLDLDRRFNTLADRDFFGGPANKWAELLQAHYLYILEQCRLPSLHREQADRGLREYRLIVLPSGYGDHTPFCVRVFQQGDSAWIHKYWFDRYADEGLRSPMASSTNRMSRGQWDDVGRQLEALGFWSMDRIDTDVPQAFHEGHMFLEVIADGRYHCVDRGTSSFEHSKDYLDFCARLSNQIAPQLPL